METKDKLYYYHNDINGAPLRLTDEAGNIVWNVHYDIFGKIDKLKINEVHNPIRMQGQYEDEETGLYYNRYRYYDPNISAYVSQDPLGLGAGENVYSYTKNSFGWIDPLGLKCKSTKREEYMGRTPGKKSKTGREVIERMENEKKIRTNRQGEKEFKASNEKWYPIKEADMSHKTDAVSWWNKTGRNYGAKSPEVRSWMRNSENYELDHYSINRSQGAKLGETYLPPLI